MSKRPLYVTINHEYKTIRENGEDVQVKTPRFEVTGAFFATTIHRTHTRAVKEAEERKTFQEKHVFVPPKGPKEKTRLGLPGIDYSRVVIKDMAAN